MIKPQFTYKISLEVRREGLLAVPVADFHAEGTLDPGRDFAEQISETHARQLERIRPRLKTITFPKYPGGSGAAPPRGVPKKSPLPGEEKARRS